MTSDLDRDVQKVRGLLTAFDLEKKKRITYDEWNLRGWHHPDVDTAPLGDKTFIHARAKADLNATYTMADAVFTGCFLNMLLRNADIVGMANYAPAVNTRGLIFVDNRGIVKRTTYHVFWMYTHLMGDQVIDCWSPENVVKEKTTREGEPRKVGMLDALATLCRRTGRIAISLINKDTESRQTIEFELPYGYRFDGLTSLCGKSPDDYNDFDRDNVVPEERSEDASVDNNGTLKICLLPHSVNVLTLYH